MEFNATFIVSAVSFIIFVFIMNAIFYEPLQKIVDKRQKFIDETMNTAKLNTEKSEKILKDKERKIHKTRHDAKQIILDKSEEVKAQKASLTSNAQQKASVNVENAKAEFEKSHDEVRDALSEEEKKLAQIISSKMLGNI